MEYDSTLDSKIKPLKDNVYLGQLPYDDVTESGILLSGMKNINNNRDELNTRPLEVIAVGPDVKDLSPGDRVYGDLRHASFLTVEVEPGVKESRLMLKQEYIGVVIIK